MLCSLNAYIQVNLWYTGLPNRPILRHSSYFDIIFTIYQFVFFWNWINVFLLSLTVPTNSDRKIITHLTYYLYVDSQSLFIKTPIDFFSYAERLKQYASCLLSNPSIRHINLNQISHHPSLHQLTFMGYKCVRLSASHVYPIQGDISALSMQKARGARFEPNA